MRLGMETGNETGNGDWEWRLGMRLGMETGNEETLLIVHLKSGSQYKRQYSGLVTMSNSVRRTVCTYCMHIECT